MLCKHRILARQFPKGTMSWIKFSDADAMCDLLFEYCAGYEPKPIFGSIIVPACLFVATECQLDDSEWEEVMLFDVRASKLWRIPPSDDRLNSDLFWKQPLVDKGGWASICIPPTPVYRKEVNPKDIVALAEWNNEYVIGKNVQSVFAAEHLSGFHLGPVRGKGGNGINSSCFHLISDHYSSPCMREATAWNCRSPNSRKKAPDYLLKGLLCLPHNATQNMVTDFCHTSDPMAACHGPGWLASKRVVETVARYGLAGWSFAPVLMEGSRVYEEYRRRMKRIESLISLNRYNAFSTTRSKGIPAEKILKMTS